MEETAHQEKTIISGKETFKLWDTYGFPLELTREVTAGRGFSVDSEGFNREMERQRERARSAQIIAQSPVSVKTSVVTATVVTGTNFVGYDCLKQKSVIVDLLTDNKFAKTIKEGQENRLMLDTTPCYV